MVTLQRPKTLKEFVIQSLLSWREPAPTLVDRDDELPTTVLRRLDSEAPAPLSMEESQSARVFDLRALRPERSRKSDPKIVHDTVPDLPVTRVAVSAPRRPAKKRRRAMTHAIVLAVVVAGGLLVAAASGADASGQIGAGSGLLHIR